jgi:hypothetical protein
MSDQYDPKNSPYHGLDGRNAKLSQERLYDAEQANQCAKGTAATSPFPPDPDEVLGVKMEYHKCQAEFHRKRAEELLAVRVALRPAREMSSVARRALYDIFHRVL